jgi:hypothetical protein
VEKATYDLSTWPVAVVTQSSQPMTVAEFRSHLDTLMEILERGRVGIVLDVRSARSIDASQRKLAADWFAEVKARYPERLACFAVVLSSQIQRGIFKAISWLLQATFEFEAFGDLEPAKQWAYACARAPYVPQRTAR